MPDSYGFNNLPWKGYVTHRCVECGWPDLARPVSQADRRRHHDEHMRERRKASEKKRKAALVKARKAKRTYRQEGHE